MSKILYSSLLVLGMLAIMAVMIFGAEGPTPPFEPVFPSYNNPAFTKSQITAFSYPVNNTTLPSEIESATGCDIAFYWECVAAKDDGKYITLNASDSGFGNGGFFVVEMSNISGDSVNSADLLVTCRQSGNSSISFVLIQPGPTSTPFGATCDDEFFDLRVQIQFDPEASGCSPCFPMTDAVWNAFDGGVTLRLGNETQKIDVDYVQTEIIIETIGTSACPSQWDMGCQISRFFDPVSRFLLAIVNIFVFIAEAGIWIGQYISNYVAVVVWLYAIPGMPIEIQAFLDAYLTVLFGVIGIELYKLAKPFGG